MILAIKTDNPLAELYLYEDGQEIAKDKWEAGNKLSLQLNEHIEKLFPRTVLGNRKYKNLTGLVVFKGPGSFTGLRIGISVANTLAYSLDIPISGASGHKWLEQGIKALSTAQKGAYIMPEYGGLPNITKQKK